MFSTGDTIVAIATPPGRGGLGVVRLSGPDAERIVRDLIRRPRPLRPRQATFARLPAAAGVSGDEVVITKFSAPASYTGEDVVEVSAHGSPVVLAGIVRRAVAGGARLARPGEFTLRAFLNGKRDLVQAEAVADLIEAVTPLQARAAFDQVEGTLSSAIAGIERGLFDLMARLEASLDFPDEGFHFIEPDEIGRAIDNLRSRIDGLLADAVRGRLVRDGALVAIIGAPNVGKSSLFNALLNANRAIVTEVPGTTRDLLTERVDIDGYAVDLVDTAGMREAMDAVEREGVQRAQGTAAAADFIVLVLDRSRALADDDRRVLELTATRPRLVVVNKVDLPPAWGGEDLPATIGDVTMVSVVEGIGVDVLASRLVSALARTDRVREAPLVTNLRHVRLLERARGALEAARGVVSGSGPALSEEFVLADLQEARQALEEVTGRRTTEDVLRHIFERFCVGK